MLRALRPLSELKFDTIRFAMAMNWLCLDGGGKWRQQKYVAFCGYLDNVSNLERFSSEWKVLLDNSGLSALHYSEAMAWQGDWRQLRQAWGEQECESKRAELIGKFIDVIKAQPTMKPIGYCGDSRGLTAKSANSKRPDLMLFERAVTIATSQLPPGRELAIICDWEDGFDELCCRLLRSLRSERVAQAHQVVLLSFGDDKAYPELQAADMFAYLICKELERATERPDEPQDSLFARLMNPVSPPVSRVPLAEMFDADTFRRMVESYRLDLS